MYFHKNTPMPARSFWSWIFILLILILTPIATQAGEFDASVAPKGHYLLRINPKIYFTSAYFSDDGKPANLDTVTGLLYFEVPVHVQYGLSGALSIGAIVPLGWTYQEIQSDIRPDPIHRLAVRELWLTVQHRWLTLPFVSSSSLRIKIPLSKKKDWEDGLRIGDGQVDVYPIYYIDYFSKLHYWYTELTIGYKYRFKTGKIKPLDELNFKAQLGYELIPDLQVRFFMYVDLTEFRNGEFEGGTLEFFEQEGRIRTFGYGLSLWPRPSLRMEMATGGDWFGCNQYRGMRWLVGITKIF